jgi:hypothetical protein
MGKPIDSFDVEKLLIDYENELIDKTHYQVPNRSARIQTIVEIRIRFRKLVVDSTNHNKQMESADDA